MSQQPGPPQQPYPPQYGQQPPYTGAPMPPPRKKSKAKLVLGIAGAFVLLLIIAAALGGNRPSGTTPTAPAAQQPAAQQPTVAQPAAPAKIVLVYEVTGAGAANNISYIADGVASTEQVTDAKLPWTKTIELDKSKAFSASLVAQAGAGTPEIAAKITANGKVIKEGKSAGQYAVVTVVGELFNLK